MSKITLTEVGNLRNETTGVQAINDNFDAIVEEFDNTLSRDGTSPNTMEANLDMNSNRILNLPEAVADTEPIRKGDFDDAITDIQAGVLAIPLSIAEGGTAGTTAAAARTNLGLGTMAVQNANNVNITGGTITGVSGIGLTIGSSIVTGGTTTRILYDNAGILGEYTISGSGTSVAMATGPTLTSSLIGLANGAVGTPSLSFTTDPDNGLYLAGTNTVGIVEAGVNIARSVAITSISDPNGASATGRMFAMLNEDWQVAANKVWVRSSDLSIHPAQVQITGVWAGGDVARIRFNTGAVNYDFSYTVQGGDTNAIIAGGLRTAVLANSTFIALPVYPQALNTTLARFDICFMYPQYPITLSNNGSTTAAGTFVFTQATNLLDGPVGFNIQRLSPGRAPIAEDNVGSLIWWGPYAAGGNGVAYGRIDTYIADPALVTLQGRMQFQTADSSITDTLNRMILRKGLAMSTSTGANPSGGTGGDMGAGTINVPDQAGHWVNGIAYWRINGQNAQLINTSATGILQLGTNSGGVININAAGTAIYPETTGATDLGIPSTREFKNLYLKTGGVIDWNNSNYTLTHSAGKLTTKGKFLISTNTGSSTLTSVLSPDLEVIGVDGSRATLEMQCAASNGTTQPLVIYGYSRGTVASPSATQSGDRLGANFAWGYGTTGFVTTGGAGFICNAAETFTDSVGGTTLTIHTTPIGSVTLAIAATFGADKSLKIGGWLGRGAPVTKTNDFTLATTENWVINNRAATNTVTLPAASSFTGREVMMSTIQAQTVVSASSNVVPLIGGAAGTAILAATAGKWATLVSDGTNWVIMQGN